MPNQTNEQKASKAPMPQNTMKGKVVFILVALLVLGGYFALDNYQYILSILKPSAKEIITEPNQTNNELEISAIETKEAIKTESEGDEKKLEIKKTFNENESSKEPAIIRFGPDLDSPAPEEDLSPYDRHAEDQLDPEKYSELAKELLIENLTKYRIYIANANELIVMFLRHENYSKQLSKIKVVTLPDEVTEIVNLMEEYLALQDNALTSKQIFPVNYKSLEKLIKVTKTNDLFQKRLELESKITDKLKIFTSYIYSSDLQKQFLGTILTSKSTRKHP